eukprot:1297942-Lingulodinium_polyedra.AAC.1
MGSAGGWGTSSGPPGARPPPPATANRKRWPTRAPSGCSPPPRAGGPPGLPERDPVLGGRRLPGLATHAG